MPFKHYTRCYVHTLGDKPFNKSDLVSFTLGVSAPGLLIAALGFLAGGIGFEIGFWTIVIQYAATITAIADQWLNHRLVCLSGNRCAEGTLETPPSVEPFLADFDNDDCFDIRLMPHRHNDLYCGPNCNYATFGSAPALLQGPPTPGPAIYGWQLHPGPLAGPSLDTLTESLHPGNDIFLDNFQGSALCSPDRHPRRRAPDQCSSICPTTQFL